MKQVIIDWQIINQPAVDRLVVTWMDVVVAAAAVPVATDIWFQFTVLLHKFILGCVVLSS